MAPPLHAKQATGAHIDPSSTKRYRRSSLHSPTKASLAKASPHVSKKSQHYLERTKSPSRRQKFPTFADNVGPLHIAASTAPGHHIGKPDNGPLQKQYLAEIGSFNNLQDFDKGTRGHVDTVRGYDAERQSDLQYQNASNWSRIAVTERGMRLSQTPPPLSIDVHDAGETTPLPIHEYPYAPHTAHEKLYGGRQQSPLKQHWLADRNLENSPTICGNRLTEAPSYYPSSSSIRIRDRLQHTFVKTRDALFRETHILEDELVIERRKASIQMCSQLAAEAFIDLPAFIAQCLEINDQESKMERVQVANMGDGDGNLPSASPSQTIHSPQEPKQFCRLAFTGYDMNMLQRARQTNIQRARRILRGHTYRSLLHFHVFVDVLEAQAPSIDEIQSGCSDWGLPEIGWVLRKFSSERNINKIIYAISSFAELAEARAEAWAGLCLRFPELITPRTCQLTGALGLKRQKIGRRDLVENLNKRAITFRGINNSADRSCIDAEITLSWHINIDSTGEAYSNISACVKVLSHVTAIDQANMTHQVSALLNILIAEYGTLEGACKLIIAFFRGQE